MKSEVSIIDYGVGNLLSVQRAFQYCGVEATITSDPKIITSASHVVFPGVGAFPTAMKKLELKGLDVVVKEVVSKGTALLAICLGMQLLMEESDEFGLNLGLGLIRGRVESIPKRSISDSEINVPHIGWNSLQIPTGSKNWDDTILGDNQNGDFVYFVHSFMVKTQDPTNRIAETNYGGHKIAAVISKDNIVGCQFHPEKSGETGLKILKKFIS
jgi:glutamine amidotransferase